MRYLLVGLGNIGGKRRAILGNRCVATVDPFNSSADYRAVGECPADQYDAAILAVPNEVKIALLEELLAKGKHVLIEKPLLLPDLTTAEAMKKLARERRVIWYTSYNHRFEPLIAKLKQYMDQGAVGRVYHGRLYYGNGTVGNVVGSWREQGLGVAEDLGSHVVDLAGYLFGCAGTDVLPLIEAKYESHALDHCVLVTADRRIVMEASFLSWKNTFSIDVYGTDGSVHLRGLCKWGGSELIRYQRVRPAGAPQEFREKVLGEDPTWRLDLDHFERMTKTGEISVANDLWISTVLGRVAAGA